MKSVGGFIGAIVVGLLFLAIGYGVAFWAGKPILDNAKASATWPNTEGVVTRSKVTTSRSDGKTMYAAEVVYDFKVKNESFTCDTVKFGGFTSSSSRGSAQKITHRYPQASHVTVFYDPEDPTNAVLENGVTWNSYLVYGFGWIFMIIGGLVMIGPLVYLGLAALVVGGVASGLIGRKANSYSPANDFSNRPTPSSTSSTPPSSDVSNNDDDGIDIS